MRRAVKAATPLVACLLAGMFLGRITYRAGTASPAAAAAMPADEGRIDDSAEVAPPNPATVDARIRAVEAGLARLAAEAGAMRRVRDHGP